MSRSQPCNKTQHIPERPPALPGGLFVCPWHRCPVVITHQHLVPPVALPSQRGERIRYLQCDHSYDLSLRGFSKDLHRTDQAGRHQGRIGIIGSDIGEGDFACVRLLIPYQSVNPGVGNLDSQLIPPGLDSFSDAEGCVDPLVAIAAVVEEVDIAVRKLAMDEGNASIWLGLGVIEVGSDVASRYTEKPTVEYCSVAYLPSPNHNGRTLAIEGTSWVATDAGVEFLLSEDQLSAFQKKLHATEFPYFNVLLKTTKVSNTPLGTTIEAYRIYPNLQ